MKEEFTRFGIPQFRPLTGILQILGGSGLVIGAFFEPFLALISASGLAMLMFLGFGVCIRIRDSFLLSAPSLLFALLNAFLAYKYFLKY